MSEQLQPGIHPDADSLNAFIEGALPEYERQQCLAHLAECARCREVVFLAQEPAAAPAPVPLRSWRRWFAPLPLSAAAAVVCVTAVAVWFYTNGPKPLAVASVARMEPAPMTQAAPLLREVPHTKAVSAKAVQAPPPQVVTQPAQPPRPRAAFKKIPVAEPPVETADRPVVQAPPPTPPLPQPAAVMAPAVAAPAASANAMLNKDAQGAAPPAVSKISVTVTDAAGAAVPGADVKLRQLDGIYRSEARTDSSGKFDAAGLAPGRYDLQVGARGFAQTTRQIDLKPGEVAAVTPKLEVGAVSETVQITAAAENVQPSTASVRAMRAAKLAEIARANLSAPRPAPLATVTSGKTMLQIDAAGTVLVSKDSGKTWSQVKPVWSGKVQRIELADPSQSPKAVFQLTTDSGAVWLSADGTRWTIQKN